MPCCMDDEDQSKITSFFKKTVQDLNPTKPDYEFNDDDDFQPRTVLRKSPSKLSSTLSMRQECMN